MSAKKVIIIALLVVLALFSGCGSAGKEAQVNPPAVVSSPAVSQSAEQKEPVVSVQPSASGAVTSRGPATKEEQEIIDSFINEKAPDFTLEDKDGGKITLSGLKGTPVVLNFWATWCPYCIQEFEHFSKAYENFPEIKFYAIDTSERNDLTDKNNRKSNEDFARGKKLTLPILFDVGTKLYSGQYATGGLPSTFLIDAQGNVRFYFAGAVKDYKTLEDMLNALLKADKG